MVHYPFMTIFGLLSWLPAGLATIIIIARGRASEPYDSAGKSIKDERSDRHTKLNRTTQDEKGKEDGSSGLVEKEKAPPKQEEQKGMRSVHRSVSRERQRDPGPDAPLPGKTYQDCPPSLAENKGNMADHTLPFHTLASDEDIRWYLENLAKIPALKSAEEQACLEQIATDPASKEAEEARHRLIEGNLCRVVRLARRYQPFGLPLADLIQDGNLALVLAARRFHPELCQRFRTYATQAISRTLTRIVEMHLRERHLRELDRGMIAPLGATTYNALMRHDLDEEAATFDFPEERLCSLDMLLAKMDTDAWLSDNSLSALDYDRIEQTGQRIEDGLIVQERRMALSACLENLTRRERQVILLRFGLVGDHVHTLEEVGRILRITRGAVRQTEERAIRKLRYPSCARWLRDVL